MSNKAFFVKFNGADVEKQAADFKASLASTFAAETYSISEVPPAGIEDVEEIIEAVSESDGADEGDDTGETGAEKAAA